LLSDWDTFQHVWAFFLLSMPDVEYHHALNEGCYDFLNTAYNDDGYVRGTRCEFPADGPKCKYTALFDDRPMFDSLREVFLVWADASCRAHAFSTAVGQVLGIPEISAQLVEDVLVFANMTRRWATMVASPDVPQSFATRTWPAYVKCVQFLGFFLSVEEIVLVSSMANVNVAVFCQGGSLLRYATGSFDGDEPIVYIKLAASNAGRVRSHFERLILAGQVRAFATAVVLEAAALAKGAEEDARREAGGKKLAQKENNAAQAHGLKGPVTGTSSGAPSAPPPPPPPPFDDGVETGTRLRGKTSDSQASASRWVPKATTDTTDDEHAYTLRCLSRAEAVEFDPRVQLEMRLEELSRSVRKHPTVPADSDDLSEPTRQAFDDIWLYYCPASIVLSMVALGSTAGMMLAQLTAQGLTTKSWWRT
jgi:hypothetical protein